ncbi:MAG: GGDEF domain-containing protein [Candidatus Omnitrophica bacterium]|nr:GGDEF domain-containing protein [Candidatus Omnitrophota bacterium]
MWRYLILNNIWFALLFLAQFFGNRRSRIFMRFVIVFALCLLLFRAGVDPFVWFFYGVFSWVVFQSAGRFRRWALLPAMVLNEELEIVSKQFKAKKELWQKKNQEDELLRHEAESLSYLYDKIKEMSQSLDSLETFVILGEALAKLTGFETIKLIELPDAPAVPVVHELSLASLEGALEWSELMSHRDRLKGEIYPSDKSILDRMLADRSFSENSDSGTAQGLWIGDKPTALFILRGASLGRRELISILIGRFLSEIQRIKLYERVEMLATTDSLTAVCVRRRLVERLEEEMERSRRFGLQCSFLMIDVDHFKSVNDHYGHLVGDMVLKQVAETIKKNIREVDLVGRYGGEEFGALLIETDTASAQMVAERIRRSMAERQFQAYDERLAVTVSIGCATVSTSMNAGQLVEAADAALYQAKRQGRNRVSVAVV